eukprot:1153088-Pelagomonas_calceolata.AAC.6
MSPKIKRAQPGQPKSGQDNQEPTWILTSSKSLYIYIRAYKQTQPIKVGEAMMYIAVAVLDRTAKACLPPKTQHMEWHIC